ncbi:MAG: hypothetical protein IT159_01005 [Bryobacterales bacterium]|nr:hypothetical protein [Bryobacterales bacterium]
MGLASVVRFFPAGPWRVGPDSGERDRVESVLHSDALYSAVTVAMAQLGMLREWLEAVFRPEGDPAVRFSSCCAFQDDLLFVIPPRSLWPPPPSAKIRWKGARFVPLRIVEALLAEEPLDEDRWRVDGLSQCLVPQEWAHGPFRPVMRTQAAVDRLSGEAVPHRTAGLEFSPGGGMWAAVDFADEEARSRWLEPVRAALRLLADCGIGGERSIGWGRFRQPVLEDGVLPETLALPAAAAGGSETQPLAATAYWLLSLFSPAPTDRIDWSRGHYTLLTRGGRVDSKAAPGALKRHSRLLAEGSVIYGDAPPRGAALDVGPRDLPHAVYRAGYALALPIPDREVSR